MLNPVCESLDDVLSKKIFEIPEYQRHYSWKTKQRADLFEDIESSMSSQKDGQKKNHFMATIVCLKTKNKNIYIDGTEFNYYDIVDGQQRLTTLIILLKAISEKLDGNAASDLNRLLCKFDGCDGIPIIKSNHDGNRILKLFFTKRRISIY